MIVVAHPFVAFVLLARRTSCVGFFGAALSIGAWGGVLEFFFADVTFCCTFELDFGGVIPDHFLGLLDIGVVDLPCIFCQFV